MKTDKQRPPTDRQIRALRERGYRGLPSLTIHEATRILNTLGRKS